MAEKQAYDYITILKTLKQSGLSGSPPPNRTQVKYDDLESIEERVNRILGLINKKDRSATNMLFFVMYDIESNKVRRYISKYLLKKGCTRIQRSIFLADLSNSVYEEIKNDLKEVQSVYENKDSIIIVPISTDYIQSMKVIGQSIDIDLITHIKNTLFF
ncbi:CRISPR-associated endonuclease Cas2 [Parabacteroides sp. Marseille-P3160]|uniref:CRISPR-associated endonuclease Cas2 n=1 Tax=Parabacteroides sp. Marseille-P3160 TaxID=1917887 RepID=UPI0009B9A2FB|nr:CRISPR-associated endonuclease Cas2 [Parabacteroides sp. Marseille-P3160]